LFSCKNIEKININIIKEKEIILNEINNKIDIIKNEINNKLNNDINNIK